MAEAKSNPALLAVRIVLFTVLGLLVVALLVDQLINIPGVKQTHQRIEEENNRINALPASESHVMTEETVANLLQRRPVQTWRGRPELGPYEVDVYRWSNGTPLFAQHLYVVYRRPEVQGVPRGFHAVYMFDFDPARDLTVNPDWDVRQVERDLEQGLEHRWAPAGRGP